MAVVVDASTAASWCFADENNVRSDATLVIVGRQGGLVPLHWWFELRNVLLINERRARLSLVETAEFLDWIHGLPIERAALPEQDAVFALARKHRLTFYDAAYLELAQRERIALATLDGDLTKAAIAEGVPLVTAA